jgi:hypothetical protein
MKVGDTVKINSAHSDWENSFGIIESKAYADGFRVRMTDFPKYPQYIDQVYFFHRFELAPIVITHEELQTNYDID